MKRTLPRALAALVLAGAAVGAACGADGSFDRADTSQAAQQARDTGRAIEQRAPQAASDAQQAVQNAQPQAREAVSNAQQQARDAANAAQQQAQQSGVNVQDLRQQARAAWASVRVDSERLIDQIQTRNDPRAKQDLLDRCRNAQERLKTSNADANAERVNELCDRIRATDVNNATAWDDIRTQFQRLDLGN
jgi:vacuolar-type H+-ATPase subunit H